jgi:AAA ATPase domain/Protein of unknown function (DUF3696)
MALLRMAVENYRSFKERQEIELRPITVILGKNNSGKSALTRFPLILQTGVGTNSDLPLDLDRLGNDPPEFLDLVHGRNMHRPLKLEMTTEIIGSRVDLRATIQNIDEMRMQFVSHLDLEYSGGQARFVWIPGGGSNYEVTFDQDPPEHQNWEFEGFFPLSRRDKKENRLLIHALILRDGLGKINYLGPYRQRPSRLTRLPSRTSFEVGAAGEHAAEILVNDHVRRQGALIGKVNDLLGDSLMGWRLEVASQGPLYAVNLRSSTKPDLVVNLLDSGTGVAQVLPLLVQLADDTDTNTLWSTLQIIEEPELHLHPAFHALLAELFVNAARQHRRFLIETHSETLLLRLRRSIAEGDISPNDVALYFVDQKNGVSHARHIHIDELGNLDYWPSGVFSEDFEETKKLAEAQFARERDES